jgi:polyferredoxin
MKNTQKIMIWFLPIIVIGGLFYAVLGYIVVGMMAFFLTLAFFKSRYWCWNLCPRGAFLDSIVAKVSLQRPVPKIFSNQRLRWSVFVLFIAFLIYRIASTGGNLLAVGAVFVSMCLLTTVISIILGVFTRQRGWCAICPMGTLQERIGRLRKR